MNNYPPDLFLVIETPVLEQGKTTNDPPLAVAIICESVFKKLNRLKSISFYRRYQLKGEKELHVFGSVLLKKMSSEMGKVSKFLLYELYNYANGHECDLNPFPQTSLTDQFKEIDKTTVKLFTIQNK